MEYGIYTVYIDYGNGGHHEMVAAFEEKSDATEYAQQLMQRVLNEKLVFLTVDNTHDGYFLFRRDTITGIRVVPDRGVSDDEDDDEDDEPDARPDGPFGKGRPELITHEVFEQMMTGSADN